MIVLALVVAAAVSGAAALAYEVCWSRALVVPLGNSMDAAALVLVGFMLGIAAGARIGGNFSERARSPLRVYALAEGSLGAFALVAPRLFASLSSIASSPVRVVVAVALVVAPCLAMGGSLPLLVRAWTAPGEPLGRTVGLAYGANTLGAAMGALVTGFFAIARIGVASTSKLAGACSALAALVALLASFHARGTRGSPPLVDRTITRKNELISLRHPALLAAFVAGFAMLGCELLWARVLTFVFGHDTYAFASLLGVVLVGLALGGLLHRALRRLDPTNVLFVTLALFAISIFASYAGACALVAKRGRDPFGIGASSDLAVSEWIELYRALAFAPLLVLAPATLSGLLFPAACAAYRTSPEDADDAGRRVGAVGLVNGVGSACGVLVVALGLVQWIGVQRSFVAIALFCGLSAIAFRRSLLGALPVVAVGALALVAPRGLPAQMLLHSVGDRHQHFLHYEESRTATVSVLRNDINGEKQLLMNAVNEVTTRLVHDQSFEVLGHLGPLLHPHPKTAVMICLGAGLSAGATLRHPIDALDVVDLSSAVQRGARLFAQENNHALDDPRLHLHIGDGRQYLLNHDDHAEGWDLAIIDSTHPKAIDSWILYTKDFYDLVRSRLNDGGVVVQWLPLHGLSEREFKIIVRTFLESFPEMSLWANAGFETYGPVAYAKLVAIKGHALSIDARAFAQKLADPKIQGDLSPFGLGAPEEILDLFLAGADDVRAWTIDLPVQTDDRPLVPYTTRYSSGRRMLPPLLLAVRAPITPYVVNLDDDLRRKLDAAYESQGLVLAGLLDRAAELRPESETISRFVAQSKTSRDYYVQLANRYPDEIDELLEAGNQLGALGHPMDAQDVFFRARALRPHDFRVRLNEALLDEQIDVHLALEKLSELREDAPTSPLILYNLGAALLASGDASGAREQLVLSLGWDPTRTAARLALAVADLGVDDLDGARTAASEVLRDNPFVAEAYDVEGLVALRSGDFDAAVARHAQAIRMNPYRAVSHYNLAVAHHAKREYEVAEREYLAALRIDPGFAKAANDLGVARRSAGKRASAVDAFCLALRADPNLQSARAELQSMHANCD